MRDYVPDAASLDPGYASTRPERIDRLADCAQAFFLAALTALVLSTTAAPGPFFRIDLIALLAAAFDE
jgi:hypothetical protein